MPRALRIRLYFGGAGRQFPWVFVAFGALLSAVFVPRTEVGCRSYDRSTRGVVERVEETDNAEDKRRIHEVVARFDDQHGQTRRVRSYGDAPPSVGDRVLVHYQSADPARAQIDGLRTAPFSPVALLVLLFPVVGLAMLVDQVREARREVHLLRHGVLTEGTVVARVDGRAKANEVKETVLTFEYETTRGQRHRCDISTFRPGVLEDQPSEAMLYDPRWPDHATTLDHLPGAPQIGSDGAIVMRGGGVVLLILPVLAVGALAVLAAAVALG